MAEAVDRTEKLRDALREARMSGRPLVLSEWDGVPAGLITDVLREPAAGRTYLRLAKGLITGRWDLQGDVIVGGVELLDCQLDEAVRLNEVTITTFALFDCRLPELAARGAEIRRHLAVRDCEVGPGGISIPAAHIGGDLRLESTRISALGATALRADSVRVEHDIMGSGLHADGKVLFTGAWIGGDFDLEEAELACEHDSALAADRIELAGSLHASGVRARGSVLMGGTRIRGQLSLKSANLDGDGDPAFVADALTVEMDAYLDDGFAARGRVSLLGASVKNEMSFRGAHIEVDDGSALSADGLQVALGLYCDEGFAARGAVRLVGAEIGDVSFTGARLQASDGPALAADGLVADRLFCDGSFEADGEVRLLGARIAGNASFDSATIRNEDNDALTLDRAEIAGTLALSDGFQATGRVRLGSAHVGQLDIQDASLSGQPVLAGYRVRVDADAVIGPNVSVAGELGLPAAIIDGQLAVEHAQLQGSTGVSVNGARMKVGQGVIFGENVRASGPIVLSGAAVLGTVSFEHAAVEGNPTALDLRDLTASALNLRLGQLPAGTIDLRGARIGRLLDRVFGDSTEAWPSFRLRGLRYEVLESAEPLDVNDRLHWLERDPDYFEPQPFEQLASAYREAGEEGAARRVQIAKQSARRRHAQRGAAKAWTAFLGITVGYGYRLWLAGVWLVVIAALGSLAFAELFTASTRGHADLIPASRTANPAPFSPVLYSIDALVPVLKFNEVASWQAHGAAQWATAVLSVLGWILTTAFVGGLVARRA